MADISQSLKQWSGTLGSNNPTSATTIGSGLAPNLQQIQATLRYELGSRSTSITATATTDIGVKDEGTILITNATGTVAINSFGTVSAGIKKLVTFNITGGALSLNYNASSMILPSLTNINVTTGDSLLAESLGAGNWKIHNYYTQNSIPLVSLDVNRNKIIGGDFSLNPWQRGIAFAPALNGQYTADRWKWQQAGTGVVTINKTLDAPTAAQAGLFSQHCLNTFPTTTAPTLAAGDFYFQSYLIEGFNAASFGFGQAGVRNVTLSFWVKGGKTGIHCVAFRNAPISRSYVAEYIINTALIWEKKSITIPVDVLGTWAYDNTIGIDVDFVLAAGTNFQTPAGVWMTGNFLASSNQVNEMDSTSNVFRVDLIQLEPGSIATTFEVRSVGQELALCTRYRRQDVLFGFRFPSPLASATYEHRYVTTEMRVTPTVINGTLVSSGNVASASTIAVDKSNFLKTINASLGANTDTFHNQYVHLDAEL